MLLLICSQNLLTINKEDFIDQISTYNFVVDREDYFPKVDKQQESCLLILLQVYANMKGHTVGDRVNYFSSKSLRLFRQFLFGVMT